LTVLVWAVLGSNPDLRRDRLAFSGPYGALISDRARRTGLGPALESGVDGDEPLTSLFLSA